MKMPHDTSIWIIYPEKRWVSAEQITSWYLDAVADGHVQNRHCTTTLAMAAELEDIGFMTRGAQPTKLKLKREPRTAEQRAADRIDGYDSDDLGESPDF